MKKYIDTITKSKYKNYFEIDINTFLKNLDKNVKTWQDITEKSFEWDLSISQYTKFSDMYNNDDMLLQAFKFIANKTKLSIKELNNYNDNIIDDIMRSCDNAYSNDYMCKMFTFTENKIINIIDEELKYFMQKYQILYFSNEDKTLHNELKDNTSIIRIYYSISEFKNFKREFNFDDYTIDEIINNVEYEFHFQAVNYEFFDYHGTVADYDNWYEIFTEYEEVSYDILKARKTKLKKLKNRIKYYEIKKIKKQNVLCI